MSDTVSGAVIVSTLGSDGPSFLLVPDAADSAAGSAVHVHGAAFTEPASLGLMVDFSTLSPDLRSITPLAPVSEEPPASVAGAAIVPWDEAPLGVPGALHQG